MKLGERLAELRRARDFTQADLAERVGVDVQTVQRAERGKVSLALPRLQQLATGLGVGLDALFVGPGAAVQDQLSPAEWQLVQDSRRVPEDRQELLLRLVRELAR